MRGGSAQVGAGSPGDPSTDFSHLIMAGDEAEATGLEAGQHRAGFISEFANTNNDARFSFEDLAYTVKDRSNKGKNKDILSKVSGSIGAGGHTAAGPRPGPDMAMDCRPMERI